jgi:hypothetical protein
MAARPRETSSAVKAYDRTETAFLIEKKRIETANAEKTARLKGLRLAKEARDREAAAAAPPAPEKKPRARKKAAAKVSAKMPDGDAA